MCILQTGLQSTKYPWNQFLFATFHFCLTNQALGANFSQIYQVKQPIRHLGQIFILVCKIPTKQVVELKFCKSSPFIHIYHWSKCQGHSTFQSRDFKGAQPPKVLPLLKKQEDAQRVNTISLSLSKPQQRAIFEIFLSTRNPINRVSRAKENFQSFHCLGILVLSTSFPAYYRLFDL